MQLFVGIDIGTTHAKGIVLDSNGSLLFEKKAGYPIIRPQAGYEEQDPRQVFGVVEQILRETIQWSAAHGDITQIGFSAGMHSLLAVDQEGNPLCHAMIWADTRSISESRKFQSHKLAGKLYEQTGVPLHPMSPFCKIAWIKQHRPELFAHTHKFISLKEYVLYRFLGSYLVDYSMASATGLFNIREKKWDPLALEMLGLEKVRLSDPVPVLHVETNWQVASRSLFPAGKACPVVMGGSDGGMANIGSGCVDPGDATLTIGTSGAVRMTVREPRPDTRQRLFCYALLKDLYVIGGGNNNGGIVLKWLDNLFGSEPGHDYVELIREAESVVPGSEGLLFLSYLLGERAPVWDPNAKGLLFGLQIQHGRNHIIRAALEGICFSLLEILEAIEESHGPVARVHAGGGFTQSDFWLQLLADITGKYVDVMDEGDASATGAAYCAMLAAGVVTDLQQLKERAKPSRTMKPDPSLHAFYRDRYRVYQSLYPAVKDLFSK